MFACFILILLLFLIWKMFIFILFLLSLLGWCWVIKPYRLPVQLRKKRLLDLVFLVLSIFESVCLLSLFLNNLDIILLNLIFFPWEFRGIFLWSLPFTINLENREDNEIYSPHRWFAFLSWILEYIFLNSINSITESG